MSTFVSGTYKLIIFPHKDGITHFSSLFRPNYQQEPKQTVGCLKWKRVYHH